MSHHLKPRGVHKSFDTTAAASDNFVRYGIQTPPYANVASRSLKKLPHIPEPSSIRATKETDRLTLHSPRKADLKIQSPMFKRENEAKMSPTTRFGGCPIVEAKMEHKNFLESIGFLDKFKLKSSIHEFEPQSTTKKKTSVSKDCFRKTDNTLKKINSLRSSPFTEDQRYNLGKSYPPPGPYSHYSQYRPELQRDIKFNKTGLRVGDVGKYQATNASVKKMNYENKQLPASTVVSKINYSFDNSLGANKAASNNQLRKVTVNYSKVYQQHPLLENSKAFLRDVGGTVIPLPPSRRYEMLPQFQQSEAHRLRYGPTKPLMQDSYSGHQKISLSQNPLTNKQVNPKPRKLRASQLLPIYIPGPKRANIFIGDYEGSDSDTDSEKTYTPDELFVHLKNPPKSKF